MQITRQWWNLDAIETHSRDTFYVSSLLHPVCYKLLGGLTCWLLPECHLCQVQHPVSRKPPKHSWQPGTAASAVRDGHGGGTASYSQQQWGWQQGEAGTDLLGPHWLLFQPWHLPKSWEGGFAGEQPSSGMSELGDKGRGVKWGCLLLPLCHPPSHMGSWSVHCLVLESHQVQQGQHIFHLWGTPGWPWHTAASFSVPDGSMSLSFALPHHSCKDSQNHRFRGSGWPREVSFLAVSQAVLVGSQTCISD